MKYDLERYFRSIRTNLASRSMSDTNMKGYNVLDLDTVG